MLAESCYLQWSLSLALSLSGLSHQPSAPCSIQSHCKLLRAADTRLLHFVLQTLFVCVCVWVCVCVCVFDGRAMRFKRETHHNVLQYGPSSLLKTTIEPCPKHNRKCNGFNGFNGNCIVFNGNYNGVYWYVRDYIGRMLNLIGKMPKTLYKKEFCNGFTGKS